MNLFELKFNFYKTPKGQTVRFIFHVQCIILLFLSSCNSFRKSAIIVNQLPGIFPDYTSLVIPPNIAPLNFSIMEKGTDFYVEISSAEGKSIAIKQSSPEIFIPIKEWKDLLQQNKGRELNIDIYVKNESWQKYVTITDTIANEAIDDHLVYRLIGAVHTDGDKLGIYQRNLENFEESIIFENTTTPETSCINCHSFSNNDPGKMSMHVRKKYPGTIIYDHGKYTKYNTKTEQTMAPAAYTAWHPNGEVIAFSLNRLFVYFTYNEDNLVEVCDKSSDIVLYNTKTNTISTSPKISGPRRECLPNWSPDGKTLYFISAPATGDDMASWVNTKYSLMKIGFDPENNIWGEVDTVLNERRTGLSITWPSASPDGKYILFCMMDHGYFSIFSRTSDLYLLDLSTKAYTRLNTINSSATDSYHAWSKNGNWVVFSSKRIDGVCTRPFFTYFDSTGKFHKPFVLPQENPVFYNSFRWNYNIPNFVQGKVNIDTSEMIKAITGTPVDVHFESGIKIDTSEAALGLKSNYY